TRVVTVMHVHDSLISTTKDDMKAIVDLSRSAHRSKLEATQNRVTELQKQQGALPERANAFSRLEQRADAVQKTFDMLAGKYYEAQIAEAVQGGKVTIVDAAVPPHLPEPVNTR